MDGYSPSSAVTQVLSVSLFKTPSVLISFLIEEALARFSIEIALYIKMAHVTTTDLFVNQSGCIRQLFEVTAEGELSRKVITR